jgi:hypothetical protein
VLRDGAPSADAWLVAVPAGGGATVAFALDAAGSSFTGFGAQYSALWIAVYNPDTDYLASRPNYEVQITFKPQSGIDLCALFPANEGLRPSPLNGDPTSVCSFNTPDGAIAYLNVTRLDDAAGAHAYVDFLGKQSGGTPTTEYGDAGYAYNIPAEDFGDSSFPGHRLLFARDRYVVEGVGGFDMSVDPPQPLPPDRLRALARHVDQQLARQLGIAP